MGSAIQIKIKHRTVKFKFFTRSKKKTTFALSASKMSFDDKFAFPELPPWKISPLPKKNEENNFVSNDALPSPLDRIKSKKGKKARALAFGLSNQSMSKSFEANQSLPVCIRKAHKSKEEMYGLVKSEHSFSYSTIFSSN